MLDLIICTVLDDSSKKDEFETFFNEYERIMFSVAMSVLKNHHDAEDALIDAFVGIAKNFSFISSLEDKAKKAYACRCARNRAINIFNSRSKRYEFEISVDEMVDGAMFDDKLNNISENFDIGVLGDVVMRLGDIYRDVLYMYYAEEMRVNEIAKELGLKVKTVQARLTRGKKALVKLIEEEKKGEKR